MLEFVNAKINLGLNIVRKRPDGYHDLETVFYPVGRYAGSPGDTSTLSDIIEVTPADADRLTMSGNIIDCPIEKNLVWRALTEFRAELCSINKGTLPPVAIHLHKNIPDGAGLGGGSADASFTLKLLNQVSGNPFNESQLLAMALRLGADCPFFIINRPCFATGVGEKLQEVALSLQGLYAVVIKPDVYISTKEAFRHVTPRKPTVPLTEIIRRPIEEWKDLMVNDFEESVFASHPSLAEVKASLYHYGALYASMSGSGSAFYGIFDDYESAEKAIQGRDYVWCGVVSL